MGVGERDAAEVNPAVHSQSMVHDARGRKRQLGNPGPIHLEKEPA